MDGKTLGREYSAQLLHGCWEIHHVLEYLRADNEVECVVWKREAVGVQFGHVQARAQCVWDRIAFLPIAIFRVAPEGHDVHACRIEATRTELSNDITVAAAKIENGGTW